MVSAGYEGKYFSYIDGNSILEFGSKNGLFTGQIWLIQVVMVLSHKRLYSAATDNYHIGMAKLHNKRLYLEYNNTLSNSLYKKVVMTIQHTFNNESTTQ